MKHRFISQALFDLLTLADWYEARSAGLGDRFTNEVEALAARLPTQPRLYGRVSPALPGHEIRQTRVPRFLALMTYEVLSNVVVILSVTHARSVRQPWRRRLP
jgi:hypothetical protein